MDTQLPFALDATNATVSFAVRWFGVVNVRGHFDKVTGTLHLGNCEGELAASVEVSSASVRTGISLRDRHLRAMRFLGADRHPAIRFDSDSITRSDDGWYVRGRLSLRGSTREVSMSVRDEHSPGSMRRLSVEFAVPRRPHGIGVSSGVRRLNPLLWAIGDDVMVRVEVLVPVRLLQPVGEHAPAR